jgi:hypothetical protein
MESVVNKRKRINSNCVKANFFTIGGDKCGFYYKEK